MGTTVFPFTASRPYTERRVLSTVGRGIGGGVTVRRNENVTPGWQFKAEFALRLPRDSQTVDDFDTFVHNHLGADTFLYLAHRKLNKTVTLEAVGTGDGSNKVFTLDSKHIKASTLNVYKDAVLQTLTTHYTFTLNNTTPTVTFVTAPPNLEAVTATYDFYMPCWFTDDDMVPELLRGGVVSATVPHKIDRLRIEEQYPGAHLV